MKPQSERLLWLDIARVLCAVMILGVHWLHAAFNVGAPISIIIQYQYQNGGLWQFLHSLLIAGTASSLSVWLTNALGLFGVFGWEAVSALILISGFSLALAQGTRSLTPREWLSWYGKRARRILVPFYLIALPVMGACALALLVLPHLHSHIAAIVDAKLHAQFHTPLLGVILSHTLLFDPWAFHWTADFFAPAWWFVPAILVAYVLYPFIRAASRYRHGVPLLAGAAVVTVAAYAAATVHLIANENWYYIALQELFNFSLGVVVAQAWLGSGRAVIERLTSDSRVALAALAVFIVANIANDTNVFRPVASMLYGPSIVLMLAFVAKLLERRSIARPLTSIDPYDLYLVHQPFAFPVALASKVLFHSYAVFIGWFVFLAVTVVGTKALTALQTLVFRTLTARSAARAAARSAAPVDVAAFTNAPKKFANVQGLRAIAALLVFGLHLNLLEGRFTGSSYLDIFSPIGNWGVDLFFVISGFVMITSTWQDFATPGVSWKFFMRRLTRIYPPYLAILIPIALLYFRAPNMVNGAQAIKPDVIASFLLLPQHGFGLLIVAWTLVYEMFFYVVFALVLIFRRRYCLPLMAIWAVTTLVASIAVRPLHNVYLDTYANPLMIDFVIGVFAGYLITVRGVPFVLPSLALGIAGLIAADLFYVGFDAAHGLHEYLRFLLVGVPVALFFLGVVGLETRYGWTFPGWMIVIGNASYSLYLWHAPLTVFVGRLSGSHQSALHNGFIHALWLAAVAAFVVGASILLYYAIERPLLRAFSRHRPGTPAPLTMLAATEP